MTRFCLTLALLASLSLAALAQDKTARDDKKKDDPAPIIVKGQLPRGWKALGLTDKQRKEVLTTRAKYAAKRQALEEQLKALKAEEQEALEKLLTDAQKQRLKEVNKK